MNPSEAICGTLGVKVVICKPDDPEANDLVEWFHGYLGPWLLLGRHLVFPADSDAQVPTWITEGVMLRNHQRWGVGQ